MQNTKNTIYTVRSDTGISHEVSEEFSIPDYMPEVRQIISCSASVIPDGKFTDGTELTLSGITAYSVLYVGDDGELSSASLNSDYTTRIPVNADPGIPSDNIPSVTSVVSVNCRATAPRRLRITTRLFSKILVTALTCHAETICAKDAAGEAKSCPADAIAIERRTADVTSMGLLCHSTSGSTSGTFSAKPGTKVISCEASPGVTEIRLDRGYAAVKGEANVTCLICVPDEGYTTVRVKSPIDERFTLPSTGDEKRTCSATIRQAAVNVRGDDNGEFTWELEYDCDLFECTEKLTAVTDDIYSTAYESTTEGTTIPAMVCLKNTTSRLSLNGTKQIPKGENKVICTSARAVTDRTEYTADGKLTVTGTCTVQCAVTCADKTDVHDVILPVKFECDCRSPEGKGGVLCDVHVLSCDSTAEEERLSATAELIFTLIAYEKRPTPCISTCTIDRSRKAGMTSDSIKIYYPTPGETLWDIGKKYHVASGSITKIDGTSAVLVSALEEPSFARQ